MKDSYSCDKKASMGQNHSMEMSEKDSFDVIPTTDIYVRPSDSEIICNTNPYLKFVAEEQASPLHTFITGFYQPEKDMHIFFRLNYDELYRIAEYAKNWKILPYTGNPDEKGIIYWMGCLNESHTYLNPITHGLVRVLTSNDYHVNYSRNEAAVSRVLEYPSLRDKDCYFDPGCIIFYFPNHVIHPTGYTYRNGGGRGSVVRKWTLEAAKSLNGPWTLISNHPEDDTFFYDVTDGQNKENSFLWAMGGGVTRRAHCWPIDCNQSRKEFYSFFRLQSQHTHPNGRSHALYISGFELFGIVKWSHE